VSHTRTPRRVEWWLAMAAAVVALTAAPRPAQAQNNSLLGNGWRAADAARDTPAPASSGAALLGTAGNARATLAQDRPEPKPNTVLLRSSPFAVKTPDPEKIKVHDLVTIIVRESKTATTDSKLESKKDWKLDSALTKWIRFSDKHGLIPAKQEQGSPAVLFDFKNDYKGDGSYDRKDELTTRVTARVIDVKPNGNLVLEAVKEIMIDDEGYRITLTGECRSKDVMPDNTILSTQIADPVIDVQHSGAVRDATRRGWIQRALDLVRIF